MHKWHELFPRTAELNHKNAQEGNFAPEFDATGDHQTMTR